MTVHAIFSISAGLDPGEAIGVFVGALLIILIASVYLERKRKDRLARWAADHFWSFTRKPTVSWAELLPGHDGDVRLLLCASIGDLTTGVAEYTYSRSRGSDSNSITSLVVTSVRLPHAYPAIAVVRRGVLSRLGRTMSGEETGTTGNAEFDDRFRIETGHSDLARALVESALIAEHLAGHVPTWSLAGHDLLTWQEGKITDPEEIPALVEPLMRVAQLLPPVPR